MGFLKRIGRGIKKAFKSVKRLVSKVFQNKIFKFVAIAAAVVFTAGVAAGAIPAFASSTLGTALASNAVTGGIFNAGVGIGQGLSAGLASIGGSTSTAAAPGAAATQAAGSTLSAAAPQATAGLGTASSAGASAAGQAAGGVSNFSLNALAQPATTQVATQAASGSSLSNFLAAAGKGAASAWKAASSISPGTALIGGQILESMTTPSAADEYAERLRIERGQDNRWGVNNLTGKPVMDIPSYAPYEPRLGILNRARKLGFGSTNYGA